MKHTLCRVLTLALALCLAFSLCLPAFAEAETLDDQLEQVTRSVKAQLGLNTDQFDSFYGDSNEQPGGTVWYLNWSGENCDLSITVLNDIITSYSFSAYSTSRTRFYGFDTTLPAYTLDQAQAAAQRFLDKVLKEGESADFTASSFNLSGPGFYFYGTILKNGLDTPLTFSLDLDGETLDVTYFYRSDEYESYVGDVDAPEAAAADKAQATEALKTTVDMELIWVLTEDGTAQLAYVPQYNNFAVEAKTGALTDLDALYADLGPWNGGGYAGDTATAEACAAEEPEADLTEAEQAGVDNLEGVLSSQELDSKIRAIAALGIPQDVYCKASYDTDPETGDVTCLLRYNCPITEENTFGADPEALAEYLEWGETPYYVIEVTVDARTGALDQVLAWSYLDFDEDAYQSQEALLAVAEGFLIDYGPQEYAAMDLYYQEEDYCDFARIQDGYFFPNESIGVSLNPVTGTITSYYAFLDDEEVTFGSAKNLITLDQAVQAYMDAGAVELGYVAWPVAVDAADPVLAGYADILAAYADYGYSYIEKLALVYKLAFEGSGVMWVDAHSGEAVFYTYDSDSEFAYTDLEGCYGKEAIEALAQFGVGFEGGTFRPTDTMTQRELMQLLVNAMEGYSMEYFEDENLLNQAVWCGFITADEWNPDKAVTRMEVLRAILNASEYGKAAALSGAYYCSFNDESGIKAADYGYVSIGQALGIIHGTPEGYFSAYSDCTRQDAAIMVYNFLSR